MARKGNPATQAHQASWAATRHELLEGAVDVSMWRPAPMTPATWSTGSGRPSPTTTVTAVTRPAR
ncbi:ABC transporter substrate-binding protein [Streptomyces rugosispiralis]|uniref:ABC transporter substrate-binding protein n=1 Tax=Streptomyces rugosispiralis TaxID=2967341 RepID=UPI003704520D